MKLIDLEGCVSKSEGYVREGRKITNFIVLAEKIIDPDDTSPEFRLEIKSGEKVYSLKLAFGEIASRKFLRKVPILLIEENTFYQDFRKALLETDFEVGDTYYRVKENGLHEVNGQLIYAVSNGSIGRNGFYPKVYSGRSGFYIPEGAVVNLNQNTEAARNFVGQLLEVFDCNTRVFYPLFFLNIASICNGYFRRIGEREFMKFTIWMDGKSGSGKTELAKSVGTFAFADECLNPNFISSTGKTKYIMEHLNGFSGGVFILDDVKNEKVRDRRNTVANIVDDILRSIYQGMLTDGSCQSIDACALITGEYMDTHESQNARMFYLKVDRFLKDDKNSKALRRLQANPLLLTTVCCSFIQWFLNKTLESSFPQLLCQKVERMRNQGKEYQGIGNAERLNENIYMLRMAEEIVTMFFRDIGLPEKYLSDFNKSAEESIKALGDDTYILLGGESMALLKVAENVLQKGKLRKAQFVENWRGEGLCKYCQEEFMINEGDDFVYIEDMEKSLEFSTDDGHDQYVSYPYLIGTEKRVLSLFAEEIENMQQIGEISPVMAERLTKNLPQKLKKAQIIFKKYRADSALGRTAVKYPICSYEPFKLAPRNGVGKSAEVGLVGRVGYESVIQMNTTHSCMKVLEGRLQQGHFRYSIPSILNICYDNTDEAEAYKVRRAFMVGKALYRE